MAGSGGSFRGRLEPIAPLVHRTFVRAWPCVLLSITACSVGVDPAIEAPEPADAARVAAWRADLAALPVSLEARHPDPWRRCARADFVSHSAALAERIPQLSNDEVVVGIAALVARLGDGHTSVAIDSVASAPARLPLRIAWLDDGPFVAAVAAEAAPLLGGRIEAIGSTPFDEAVERVIAAVAIDNAAARRVHGASLLTDLRVLHACGLAARDGATFAAVSPTGERVTVALTATGAAPRWLSLPSAASAPMTLRARPEWFWWLPLPEQHAVYLRADRCAYDPPAGAEFADVVDEVARHLDGAGRGCRVVLDLRFNPGGNDKALGAMFALVDRHSELARRGNLLVLIGRRTFSSAGLVALWLRERCGAVLVGEPAGMKPNSFGQVREFELPHSRLLVHCSTKEFRFVAGDPPSLLPDVTVPLTSAVLFGGRDPVLEAAFAVPVEGAGGQRRRARPARSAAAIRRRRRRRRGRRLRPQGRRQREQARGGGTDGRSVFMFGVRSTSKRCSGARADRSGVQTRSGRSVSVRWNPGRRHAAPMAPEVSTRPPPVRRAQHGGARCATGMANARARGFDRRPGNIPPPESKTA